MDSADPTTSSGTSPEGATPAEPATVPAPGDAAPTLLARARALWCQLVSGLG